MCGLWFFCVDKRKQHPGNCPECFLKWSVYGPGPHVNSIQKSFLSGTGVPPGKLISFRTWKLRGAKEWMFGLGNDVWFDERFKLVFGFCFQQFPLVATKSHSLDELIPHFAAVVRPLDHCLVWCLGAPDWMLKDLIPVPSRVARILARPTLRLPPRWQNMIKQTNVQRFKVRCQNSWFDSATVDLCHAGWAKHVDFGIFVD